MKELKRDAPARLVYRLRGAAQRRHRLRVVDEAIVASARARTIDARSSGNDQSRAAARAFGIERRERRAVGFDAEVHGAHDDAIGKAQRADRSGLQRAFEQWVLQRERRRRIRVEGRRDYAQPSIDADRLAGDVLRFRREQKCNRVGNLLGGPHARLRNFREDLLNRHHPFDALVEIRARLGVDEPAAHAVDVDPARRELDGHVAHPGLDCGFVGAQIRIRRIGTNAAVAREHRDASSLGISFTARCAPRTKARTFNAKERSRLCAFRSTIFLNELAAAFDTKSRAGPTPFRRGRRADRSLRAPPSLPAPERAAA